MNNYLQLLAKLRAKKEDIKESLGENSQLQNKKTSHLENLEIALETVTTSYQKLKDNYETLKNYDSLIASIKRNLKKSFLKNFLLNMPWFIGLSGILVVILFNPTIVALKVCILINILYDLVMALVTYCIISPDFKNELWSLSNIKENYTLEDLENKIFAKEKTLANIEEKIASAKEEITELKEKESALLEEQKRLEDAINQIIAKLTGILNLAEVEKISNAEYENDEELKRTLTKK